MLWTARSTDIPYYRARKGECGTWFWYDEWMGYCTLSQTETPTHWVEITPPVK